MHDPIPEGHLSLPEVFEAHYQRKYGVAPTFQSPLLRLPVSYKATYDELITAFRERQIQALVREPGEPGNSRVQAWWDDGFPERIFMCADFPAYSKPFADLTPFVNEAIFSAWSENAVRKFREADPSPATIPQTTSVEPIASENTPTLRLTRAQQGIADAIAKAFPDGVLPARAADRDRMIRAQYRQGEIPPTSRTIQRYLKIRAYWRSNTSRQDATESRLS